MANTVKRLAFISAATVYKDIIPGYHIRALTEAEQGTRTCLFVSARSSI